MRKGPTPRYEMWWKKSRLYAYFRLRKYGQRVKVVPTSKLYREVGDRMVLYLDGMHVPGTIVQQLANDGREVVVAVEDAS